MNPWDKARMPAVACGYFVFREEQHPLSPEPLRIMVASGTTYPLGAEVIKCKAKPGDVLMTAMAVGPSNDPNAMPPGLCMPSKLLPPGHYYGRLHEIVASMSFEHWLKNAKAGCYPAPERSKGDEDEGGEGSESSGDEPPTRENDPKLN